MSLGWTAGFGRSLSLFLLGSGRLLFGSGRASGELSGRPGLRSTLLLLRSGCSERLFSFRFAELSGCPGRFPWLSLRSAFLFGCSARLAGPLPSGCPPPRVLGGL